jgi:viroplasmin and RNaseH domain-containing protein
VSVSGSKDNKYKGFRALQEARTYMKENGISEYQVIDDLGELNLHSKLSQRSYYAVANGREKGIYKFFQYVVTGAHLGY